MKKPSVSDLISILDKPALLKWANKIGLEGIHIDDYQKQSKSDGISHHNQIENFVKYNIDFEDEKLAYRWKHFVKDKEIISIEHNIESDYFIGRLDCILKYKDSIYICDFKSTKYDKIFFEQKLQLVAYKMCYPDYKIAIVKLPYLDFIEIELDSEFEYYKNILIALSVIYSNKLKIKKM
jgi:hypothetical protein